MFGEWTRSIDALHDQYMSAGPIEHIVIPNFFTPDMAEKVYAQFPDPDATWFTYDNPFEGKYIFNQFQEGDPMKAVIDSLYTDEFIEYMSRITGIPNLESDEYLNAGGLHAYTRNGVSGVHLDYTIHPVTGKERRATIMVYMSKDWNDDWGGHLKLYDENISHPVTLTHSLWNTAVIFRTNGKAYHGFPDPIKCPHGAYRKVIGIYYMTDPTPETLECPRKNAQYFIESGKPVSKEMQKLLDIRRSRRLTPDDLLEWPTWRRDCGRDD